METCLVCTNEFGPDDIALDCGHWIHRDCIQKHADAMQDLRQQEGYPPLTEASCPVCRATVSDIVPKKPEQVEEIIANFRLHQDDLTRCAEEWAKESSSISMSFFIWIKLCTDYPDISPESLLVAAHFYSDLIYTGSIVVKIPDTRFSRALQLNW